MKDLTIHTNTNITPWMFRDPITRLGWSYIPQTDIQWEYLLNNQDKYLDASHLRTILASRHL